VGQRSDVAMHRNRDALHAFLLGGRVQQFAWTRHQKDTEAGLGESAKTSAKNQASLRRGDADNHRRRRLKRAVRRVGLGLLHEEVSFLCRSKGRMQSSDLEHTLTVIENTKGRCRFFSTMSLYQAGSEKGLALGEASRVGCLRAER